MRPDDLLDPSLRWYIDGSRRYPAAHCLATTGCGLTIVDDSDCVVGAAYATPPAWVTAASAAETWALLLVLKEVVAVPCIFTDCLGLLVAAQNGVAAATAGKRNNARIWNLIAEVLNGSFDELRRSLVWLPAHTSVDACRERKRSDGRKLSVVDWRANQLCDKLAKRAAAKTAARDRAMAELEDAKEALLHHGAILGRATHAANNCMRNVQLADGRYKLVSCRDTTALDYIARRGNCKRRVSADEDASQQLPSKRMKGADGTAAAAAAANIASADGNSSWHCRAADALETRRRKAVLRRRAAAEQLAECVRAKLQRLQPTCSAGGGTPSAAQRLAALRARVLAKTICAA